MLQIQTHILLLIAWFIYSVELYSQNNPLNPSPLQGSPLLGVTAFNLSFTQSASKDWVQGEDNTLSSRLAIKSINEYNNLIKSLGLRYSISGKSGATYYEDSPDGIPQIRANDNEFLFDCQITLNIKGWLTAPYFAVSLKTPITESFSVSKNRAIRVASLWDPVSSQESCGGAWRYASSELNLSSRLGVRFEQIRSYYHTQTTDDPKTAKEKERYKAVNGMESNTELIWKPDSLMNITSRLALNGNANELKVWNVKWDTEIRIRVWKLIGIIFMLNVLQDPKQNLRTQIKQTLSFGFLAM